MIDAASLPYRAGVGVMLLNADGHVFVGQRLDNKLEAWQMPQGGIDDDETPLAAAYRELGEETGVLPDKVELIGETPDWLTYDLPPELVPIVWKGRFRGQRQKWFAFRFTGADADVNIATAEPEFRAWMWTPRERLVDIIVPFKRDLYAAVLAALPD